MSSSNPTGGPKKRKLSDLDKEFRNKRVTLGSGKEEGRSYRDVVSSMSAKTPIEQAESAKAAAKTQTPAVTSTGHDQAHKWQIHDDKPMLIEIPEAERVDCFFQVAQPKCKDDEETFEVVGCLGSIERPASNAAYHLKLHLDYGRVGMPSLSVEILHKRKAKKDINRVDQNTFFQSFLTWQPGEIAYTTADKREVYQIDNAQLTIHDVNNPQEFRSSLPQPVQRYIHGWNEDETRLLRLVKLNFLSRHVSISETHQLADMKELGTPQEKRVIEAAYRQPTIEVVLVFLVDYFSANEWLYYCFYYFRQSLETRNPPLYQYLKVLDTGGQLVHQRWEWDITVEMANSRVYANRALATHSKADTERQQKELLEHRRIKRFGTATGVRKLPLKYTFSGPLELGIYLLLGNVRAEQFSRAHAANLSYVQIAFLCIKMAAPRDANSSRESEARQSGIYLIGRLPKNANTLPPQEGSSWWVHFPPYSGNTTHADHVAPPKRYRAYCAAFVKAENAHGGDFLLVATPLSESPLLPTATLFESATWRDNSRPGYIEPLVDNTSFKRIENAIATFCDPDPDNFYKYADFIIPMCGSIEKGLKMNPLDLTIGPDRNVNISARWEYLVMLAEAYEIIRDPTEAQKELLTVVPKTTWGKVQIILGGPGCLKTTTVSLLVVLCMLCDWRILIVSKNNHAVNKMMGAIEKHVLAFKLGLESQQQMPPDADGTPQFSLLDAEVLELVTNKDIIGNLPAAMETRALSEPTSIAYTEQHGESDTVPMLDIGGGRQSAALFDPEMMEHALERLSNEEVLTTVYEEISALPKGGTEGHAKLEKQAEEAMGKLQNATNAGRSLINDFERLPLEPERGFNFPLRHALIHKMAAIRAEIETADSDSAMPDANKAQGGDLAMTEVDEYALIKSEKSDAMKEYDAALSALADAQAAERDLPTARRTRGKDDDDSPVVKAACRVTVAQENLMGAFFKNASIVGTSYVNSQSPVIMDNFKPHIVIHEEGTNANVAEAACGFAIPGVLNHILLGDQKQIGPFSGAEQFDEVAPNDMLSLLEFWLHKGVTPLTLMTQRRMHPDLCVFLNSEFYGGLLTSAAVTMESNPIRDLAMPVLGNHVKNMQGVCPDGHYYMVNVYQGVSFVEEQGTSMNNFAEAAAILSYVEMFVNAGVPREKIVILCNYAGQKKLIARMLAEKGHAGFGLANAIGCMTVDIYQGDDEHIVLYATTMTAHTNIISPHAEDLFGRLSPHVKNPKRICVATSRAKDILIVFANCSTLVEACERAIAKKDKTYNTVWNMIVDASHRQRIIMDNRPDDNPALQKQLRNNQDAMARYNSQIAAQKNLADMDQLRFKQLQKARGLKYGRSDAKFNERHAGPDASKWSGQLSVDHAMAFKGRDTRGVGDNAITQGESVPKSLRLEQHRVTATSGPRNMQSVMQHARGTDTAANASNTRAGLQLSRGGAHQQQGHGNGGQDGLPYRPRGRGYGGRGRGGRGTGAQRARGRRW